MDYSQAAVDLAKKVAAEQEKDFIQYEVCKHNAYLVSLQNDFTFMCYFHLSQTCDFLDDLSFAPGKLLKQKYDVILDKGTYDAISLNPDDSLSMRSKYISNLLEILQPNGVFIITSCNWTEEELKKQFSSGKYMHGQLLMCLCCFNECNGLPFSGLSSMNMKSKLYRAYCSSCFFI